MSENDDPVTESNPYSSVEQDQSPDSERSESSLESAPAERPAPNVSIWLPAVLIAVMWCIIVIPGMIAPQTMLHFMTMQFAPALGVLAMLIWWLASRRIPWRQRFAGIGLVFAITAIGLFAGHRTLTIVMIVFGLPVSLTMLVGALLITRGVEWQRRRWIGVGAFSIVMIGSLFFRAGEMDANMTFTLVPRWRPTAEDRLLAEIASSEPVSEASALELPEQPGNEDWPGFRGSDRRGVIEGVSFAADWDVKQPKELWRRNIGPAWSSFCVIGPVWFTQEQRGDEEVVAAYRVDDGSPVWSTTNSGRFEASMGGPGPRATPTFAAGKLYTVGGDGLVQCLDAQTGKQLWGFDLMENRESPVHMWGFASSALVHDGLVIVYEGDGQGRGVVALNASDGTVAWRAGDGTHSYGSPQLSNIDGVDQILISNNRGVRSLDPATGDGLWQYDWNLDQIPRVTQPLVDGNTVYLGTGYGNGTRRFDVHLDAGAWEIVDGWTAPLKPYFNDFVSYQGHLYGFDGSIFISINGETGEKNWKRGRYGHGQLLLVQDMGTLVIAGEKGQLVLLKANPEKHEEIASIEAFDEGVTWNHPVIAQGRLFLRNDQQAVCYELP